MALAAAKTFNCETRALMREGDASTFELYDFEEATVRLWLRFAYRKAPNSISMGQYPALRSLVDYVGDDELSSRLKLSLILNWMLHSPPGTPHSTLFPIPHAEPTPPDLKPLLEAFTHEAKTFSLKHLSLSINMVYQFPDDRLSEFFLEMGQSGKQARIADFVWSIQRAESDKDRDAEIQSAIDLYADYIKDKFKEGSAPLIFFNDIFFHVNFDDEELYYRSDEPITSKLVTVWCKYLEERRSECATATYCLALQHLKEREETIPGLEPTIGIGLMEGAAERGNIHALLYMANAYVTGAHGVKQDEERALTIYKELSPISPEAMCQLAVIQLRELGRGNSDKVTSVKELISDAADLCLPKAIYWKAILATDEGDTQTTLTTLQPLRAITTQLSEMRLPDHEVHFRSEILAALALDKQNQGGGDEEVDEILAKLMNQGYHPATFIDKWRSTFKPIPDGEEKDWVDLWRNQIEDFDRETEGLLSDLLHDMPSLKQEASREDLLYRTTLHLFERDFFTRTIGRKTSTWENRLELQLHAAHYGSQQALAEIREQETQEVWKALIREKSLRLYGRGLEQAAPQSTVTGAGKEEAT